ncbi:DoxX family protein [Amycolatopsis echigonensis]|uniref:DoxX family protein n=1 Tax=Amycolatopsis echigonensis TaxID=2576905 RepID=A0A2N3WSC9_9PSEU|nr:MULTISPECIES: DoxX family protein [Amycolatopsis]MBB2502461.1 DoxX family protein [Amycolatopsis echigonensis]PKV96766.1 putative oxidoreductase [Amycolatopsis niigatensis]
MPERVLDRAVPFVLGLFRIVVGLLFAAHGAAALFGVFGGGPEGGTVAVGVWPSWYAAVIQLGCGLLVAFGLGTRIAALLASGSMAYAYFVVHQPDGLLPLQNHGEPAAMFCWAFLLLVFTGPGALALDALFGKRSDDAGGARPLGSEARGVLSPVQVNPGARD